MDDEEKIIFERLVRSRRHKLATYSSLLAFPLNKRTMKSGELSEKDKDLYAEEKRRNVKPIRHSLEDVIASPKESSDTDDK